MSGYTPAFDSIYDGTLYGRWPAAAVMATLIPLIDAKGCINRSFEAIAGMTGWPMELLKEGIAELERPDPHSRTPAEEGRRLVKLDPARPWGWRVVNHTFYREKARKMAYDKERTESGRDAERKKAERDVSREVPRSPAMSREVPLSDSYADTDTSSEHARAERSPTDASSEGRARTAKRGSRIPEPFMLTSSMREWAKSETPDVDLTAATAEFVDYWRGVPGQKGCKLDWEGTWRNRMRENQARIAAGRPTPAKRAKVAAGPRTLPDAFEVARRGNGG